MDTTVDVSQVEEVINIAKSQTPQKIIAAAIVLVVGLILSRMVVKLINRLLEKYRVVPSVTSMLRTMIRFVIDLIVVMIATYNPAIRSRVSAFAEKYLRRKKPAPKPAEGGAD